MACVLKATLSRASTKPRWVITAYAIFFGGVLLLGGALTSGLNWSWIFFLNVPIGVLLIGVSPVLLPEICAARRHRHLDIGGAVSITPLLPRQLPAIVTLAIVTLATRPPRR